MRQNAAARIVGLRLLHGREIDVPLYAFSTSLTQGGVATGARRLARRLAHPARPWSWTTAARATWTRSRRRRARTTSWRRVVPFLKRSAR